VVGAWFSCEQGDQIMQTKIIHEGTVMFEGAVGVDRPALARAIEAGVIASKKSHYQLMRHPLTAAGFGVRPWPEHLPPENVASWIVANVIYSMPSDAHSILKAMVFENNA
jgi:hypothetical protein